MTWKELKEKIEKLSEKQLNEPVSVWGPECPFSNDVELRVSEEDFYSSPDWDYAIKESEMDEDDKYNEEKYVICEKGTPYLFSNEA